MKYLPGPIAGAGSGSVGSLTASRNRFGPYFRTRAIPVNPSTNYQQVVRSHLTQLTSLWVNTLTETERAAWATYGANVPMTDVFGAQIFLTGLNHYVRSNVPRLLAGLVRLDIAPTIFDLGDYSTPTIAIQAVAATLDVSFNVSDDWVGEDGSALLCYHSRQNAPSINFFKGPYRFAAAIEGNALTPPTSPENIPLVFSYTANNAGFFRCNVTRVDGRLSSSFRTRTIAV